jgi:hypothetical protein
LRVKNLEDGVVHFAKSKWKTNNLGFLLCQPNKRVVTWNSAQWLWEDTQLPVTCPECIALSGGRDRPRRETKRRAGSKGMSKIPELNGAGKNVPPTKSGMGRIKTNGWIHMTTGKFGRRVTAKESRQRIKKTLKDWDE